MGRECVNGYHFLIADEVTAAMRNRRDHLCALCCVVLACAGIVATTPITFAKEGDLILNGEGVTYDTHPAMATSSDATAWIAWHGYLEGRDRILVRSIDATGNLEAVQVASGPGSVHGPPAVVRSTPHTTWVVWSAKIGNRWRVLARKSQAREWGPVATLSSTEVDAIWPAAVSWGDGRVLVSWAGYGCDRFDIRCRIFDNGDWSPTQRVSTAQCDAYRPALAKDEGGAAWVVWDQYRDGDYSVWGRQVAPETGPVESVSPKGRFCLRPTALFTRRGLFVAWLRKADVTSERGVISQWHTLEMATRREGSWQMVAGKDGDQTAAHLTHGLMAKIAPEPVATGGYLGQRTQPMLLGDGDDIWLLWERKADHRASTPNAVGELLARPVSNAMWGETVVLHQGSVDYHLAHPRRATNGQFVFLASSLPRENRRIYRRVVGDLRASTAYRQDTWHGWRPVQLPVQRELTERRQIQLDGKTYQLYWVDLHCHSGLTADAEGEPDELTHYARDRAMLDAVVFTENDFIYDVPLTEYEYELGNFFAAAYSRENRFLSLPGYEWTSRVPGVAVADIADPGNWTTPYKNRSFPNHRSVIYPPSGGPVVRYPEVGNDITRLNQAVEQAGGVTLTQHNVFDVSEHVVEVGMEVTSGWHTYVVRRPVSFHDPLNRGVRLALVANGDSHRRAPGLSGGLTGIYAERLTPTAILDSLRKRRCYATHGSRVFVDARANDVFMGRAVKARQGAVTMTLRVSGTRPIVSATLIRDGAEWKSFPGDGERELSIECEDRQLSVGTHWYYWRIAQQSATPDLPGNLMVAHGHLAWSSPLWVMVE